MEIKIRLFLILVLLGVCFGIVKCIGNESGDITPMEDTDDVENVVEEEIKGIVTHVTLTCYQPVESQCDSSPLITADNSKIDLDKLKNGEIKWCAVSRNLLYLFPKDKPKRVYIEGYGIYEVRDKMNKRFSHRLDILIHPDDNTRIMEKNVKW